MQIKSPPKGKKEKAANPGFRISVISNKISP